MADESAPLGTARVDVVVDTTQFDAAITSAKSKTADMSQAAQQAYAGLNAAQQKTVDSLNRSVAALGKTRAELLEMKAASASLPTSIFDDFKSRIEKAGSAVEQFSLNNSNARRELGRLASDMVNGNYGRFEQTALTLANYTGVLGKVFSGTGLLIAGAGAAVLAFGAAVYEGNAEVEGYNKALLLTGSYAGVTAQQLQDMARQSANGVSQQHDFAEALKAVTASGRFTADQIRLVGTAAVNMNELSGQSVQDTIKQFEELQKAPLKAAVALNDAQHFLTLSQYEQIKALQDQGQAQQAATLAMTTYANTIADRKDDAVKNLGLIEQAWHGIESAAKAAANAALNVGRPDTDQQKFDQLSANLQRYQAEKASGANFDLSSGQNLDKIIASTRSQMAAMQDAFVAQQKQASAAALQAQLVQDKSASDAEVQEYATHAQKRAEDILKVQGEYNDRIARAVQAGNTDLAAKLRASEALVIAGIKEKYKDPKQPKTDPFQDLNGLVQKAQVADSNFGINNGQQTEQVQKILAIVDAGAKLIKSGHDVTQVQADVAKGVAAVNELYGKEAQQLQTKNAAALAAYVAGLDKENAALALNFANQVKRLSMGDQQYEQAQQIAKAYEEQAAKLQQVAAKQQEFADTLGKSGYSQQTAQAYTEAIQLATNQQVKIINDGYAQIAAAQANWENGAVAAFQNYQNNAANVAAQTKNVFTGAFNDMSDALLTFETTGKLSFDKFVVDILEGIAKIENAKLVSGIAGSLFGGGTGAGGGNSASIFDALSFNPSFTANAKGGVYSSPSLSSYSNGVYSSPQMFAFAKGAGVFGEAGPEAIMPLKRDSNGNLGVRAAMSGGNSPITVQIVTNVDASGNSQQQVSANDQNTVAKALGTNMAAIAKQTIVTEMRPGGVLWRGKNA